MKSTHIMAILAIVVVAGIGMYVSGENLLDQQTDTRLVVVGASDGQEVYRSTDLLVQFYFQTTDMAAGESMPEEQGGNINFEWINVQDDRNVKAQGSFPSDYFVDHPSATIELESGWVYYSLPISFELHVWTSPYWEPGAGAPNDDIEMQDMTLHITFV